MKSAHLRSSLSFHWTGQVLESGNHLNAMEPDLNQIFPPLSSPIQILRALIAI